MSGAVNDDFAWGRIVPYLDQALDLKAPERERWLVDLTTREPIVAATLRQLLAEYQDLNEKRFLTGSASDAVSKTVLQGWLKQRAALETGEFADWHFKTTGHLSGAPVGVEGAILGTYRLLREIGQGGMSSVWLAERCDGQLKREVALKLPYAGPRRAQLAERLQRERDILATLTHPNIARLYDAGISASGQPYLAMEYVEGTSLTRYCDAARLSIRERLKIFLQALIAVEFAHEQLVLHRDLKPSNILVTEHGRVVLLDFGIAKLLSQETDLETPPTEMVGRMLTPDYASPEHIGGDKLGTTSDIYSLGVMLFELLVGARPFGSQHESRRALEDAILKQDPPRPSQLMLTNDVATARHTTPRKLSQTLKSDLDAIVLKALKKAPTERYKSISAFAQDIVNYLESVPVSARPDSHWYRFCRFVSRYKLQVTAAAVAAAAIIVGGAMVLWQWQVATKHRAIAVEMLANSEATLDFARAVLMDGIRNDEAITVDELRSRSEAIATRLGKNDARTRVVVTNFVADWYLMNDQFDKAEKLLTRTIDSLPAGSRFLGTSSLICQRAYDWSQLGHSDEAIVALRQEIERSSNDVAAIGSCLQFRAEAALDSNDAKGGLEYSLLALRRFDEVGQTSMRDRAALLADIGTAYSLNGMPDRSQAYYAQAFDLIEQTGRADSVDASTMLNNWGIVVFSAGNPLRALDLFEQSVAILRRRSPAKEQDQYVTANMGHVLRLLARYPEAIAAFDMALRTGGSSSPDAEVYAIEGKARVAILLGRFDQAQLLLQEGAAKMQDGQVRSGSSGALMHKVIQGEVWAAQGRLTDAATAFTEAIDSYTNLGCCSGAMSIALLDRAGVGSTNHRIQAALDDALQALKIAQKAQGHLPYSNYTGKAWLVLGNLRQMQGNGAEAKKAYVLAAKHLANTVGDEHPDTLQARQLAAATTS